MGDNKGQFKPGNQIWRLAKNPGQPAAYTPDELWEKYVEYINANAEYAWEKDDFIKSGPDAGKVITIHIPNPPSIRMFTLFAQISESTLFNYEKKTEYVAVVNAIKGSIQDTQIGGAATNLYNSNIIARWAGLVDKKELDVKSDLSDDERSDMIRNLLEKVKKQ